MKKIIEPSRNKRIVNHIFTEALGKSSTVADQGSPLAARICLIINSQKRGEGIPKINLFADLLCLFSH